MRAFLRFGLRFGEEGLTRHWEEIENRPSDPRARGVRLHEFEWMLAAAAVRDAVTLYEVYLEQAAEECFSGMASNGVPMSPRGGPT